MKINRRGRARASVACMNVKCLIAFALSFATLMLERLVVLLLFGYLVVIVLSRGCEFWPTKQTL